MRSTLVSPLLLCVLLLVLALVAPGSGGGNLVSAQGFFDREMDRVRSYAAANYMQRIAQRHNVSSLPSGVLFTVAKRGHGTRAPAADDECEMHFTEKFRFDKKGVRETSRGRPYPVRRSPASFVPGAAEALQLMREGDRWHIYVPFERAYGRDGDETRGVPSLSNMRYDLELFKCPGARGRTSEEIDAYLKPIMKIPMPAPSDAIESADL